MNRLDNKGFAISGILYTLLVLFLTVLLSVLGILRTQREMFEKSISDIEDDFSGHLIDSNQLANDILSGGSNIVAPVSGKYIFRGSDDGVYDISSQLIDTNGNEWVDGFLVDLYNNNVTHKDKIYIRYQVKSGTVTVCAKEKSSGGDSFGFIRGVKLKLNKGQKYRVSCNTEAKYEWSLVTSNTGGTNTVQMIIMPSDNNASGYYLNYTGGEQVFEPLETKDYYLRFDINTGNKGDCQKFWDIKIEPIDDSGNVKNGSYYCPTYLKKGDIIDKNIRFVLDECNNQFSNMVLDQVYSFEEGDNDEEKD